MIFETLYPILANQIEKKHIYTIHNKLQQQLSKKSCPYIYNY